MFPQQRSKQLLWFLCTDFYHTFSLRFERLLKQHTFHCPCSSPECLDRMAVSTSVSSFPCCSVLWDMSFFEVLESKLNKLMWPLLRF